MCDEQLSGYWPRCQDHTRFSDQTRGTPREMQVKIHYYYIYYSFQSLLYPLINKWAVTCDFQQCGIFISVDSD